MRNVLEVNNLTKIYSGQAGKDIRAVDGVSLAVPQGKIFGLLGPNGAGKTTTVKAVCGLVRPDSGSILVNGYDVLRQRPQALGQMAAVLEGNRNVYWRLTPTENLEFFAALRGRRPGKIRQEIRELLEMFGLTEKAGQPVRNLSRGMQQKLAVAVTLVTGAPILMLDEPTLGLDVTASIEVRKLLCTVARERQRTVIITTHDMNVVQEICDHVVIINEGRVVADDSTSNLLNLFQVRSYELAVGVLSAGQQQGLSRIPHLQLENTNGSWLIRLDMENPAILWQVLDILRAEETPIDSIGRKELNFEKVFLEILGRKGA